MKKKSALFSACLALAVCFLLASCGIFGLTPVDGSIPSEVAVSRGEAGSRESFLAAQETPVTEFRRAFEEAKKDGYPGTYYEFLEGLGLSDDGAKLSAALRSSVSVFAFFSTGKKDRDVYNGGSGTIFDLDASAGTALIVTNYHVVYNAESTGREPVPHISDDIEVYLYGEFQEAYLYGENQSSRGMTAEYVGGAMQYDIAVLSVKSDLLKGDDAFAAELVAADSDSLMAGDKVYAVGNADGEGLSVTEGVVSVPLEYVALKASDGSSNIQLPEIRTDAELNHGNSGGGLFTAEGEFVGVVNARSEKSGVNGFGYAIPANCALALAQNIIDTCAADPAAHGAAVAFLGVTPAVETVSSVYDETTGRVYSEEKIVLDSITYGSLADRSGLMESDTLISASLRSAEGETVRTVAVTALNKFTDLLYEVRLGDTLELTVSRGGDLTTVEIAFAEKSCFRAMS